MPQTFKSLVKYTFCVNVLRWGLLKDLERGFPGGKGKDSALRLSGKDSACSAGDLGSILGLGISSEGGHGNPLQYSCLENPMDRGVWRAAVHRVAQSDMTEATKQQQQALIQMVSSIAHKYLARYFYFTKEESPRDSVIRVSYIVSKQYSKNALQFCV